MWQREKVISLCPFFTGTHVTRSYVQVYSRLIHKNQFDSFGDNHTQYIGKCLGNTECDLQSLTNVNLMRMTISKCSCFSVVRTNLADILDKFKGGKRSNRTSFLKFPAKLSGFLLKAKAEQSIF